jgi:hypothetical protein
MRKCLGGALAILLAVIVEAPKAETFPVGNVFAPLIADPGEPRFFVSVLKLHTAAVDRVTIASVGGGTDFGLYRWAGERPDQGWQVGIFGSVFSQFNLDADSTALVNSDFRIGLPLTYKRGEFSGRARIFHQSSHLGDELILSGNAPQRVNLSIEAFDFVLAWERGAWRPYAGGFYLLSGNPAGLKKTGVHAGLDYAGHALVLGGRLVGGLDLKSFDETGWRISTSAKLGLELGRRHPERRGVTLLLEAYKGSAPFGQFYRDYITYYGLAVQFDTGW